MGREPTSASCHTCRRRRIKCDQQKPSCAQCQRSRYECLGYDRILRIQSHGVGRSSLVKIGQSTSFPSEAPGRDEDNVGGPSSRDGGRSRRGKPEVKQTAKALQQATQPLTSQPNLDPFVDNVTFSYFFDAYGWINMHSIFLQDTPMRQHLTQQTDELGYDSLRALAYGIFSRDHHVEPLRHKGQRIYGTILQRLQSRLGVASKSELATLIKPISILGSYAIAVDSDLRFVHHEGLARILEHCGPECFTDPLILPVFESCRFTMLANALVQRRGTFLEQEKWKTIPWSLCPENKSNTNKLLDILSSLPSTLEKTDRVLNERSQWVAGDCTVIREETPTTVPELQQQLESMFLDLLAWRYHWSADNAEAQDVLNWALYRVSDESYRPVINGVHGPDVYGLNLGNIPFETLETEPETNANTFALMQEVALYITIVISMERLRKNLAGAARAADAIDFYNAPFFSTCRCYFDNPGPSRLCQIFPEPNDYAAKAVSWNFNTAIISEAPVRSSSSSSNEAPMPINHSTSYSSITGTTLLPGDGRFIGQLRILNSLIKHLPESRAYVLGTLAAMGLSHCVHDVRPLDGNEYIAETIRETMLKSKFGDAADVLLKRYR
ncbi:hypothetical protein BBK36DRAFT_1163704 [Trichoderma citrinoviride]|uniref:Zn(2)-C6 fungal-type domain-containing protein n=1 Tax=Trichoderma citrinoviride TaxID=58853 RepID=A0A2T4AX72_9HYPO|nr:hypothetical protein BBK36DRAFT_1163704 [Trichoderma citrinoviride]PTB61680.1 hypothetical protein BBK36DRAFT_1163704 [Trichoderma citrinoviride]